MIKLILLFLPIFSFAQFHVDTNQIKKSLVKSIEANVLSVKMDGNIDKKCDDSLYNYKDIHIYICYYQTKRNNKIVEISCLSKLHNANGYNYVQSLVGHKVTIYGYEFSQQESYKDKEEIYPILWIERLDINQ
jgi:hypothetical protein